MAAHTHLLTFEALRPADDPLHAPNGSLHDHQGTPANNNKYDFSSIINVISRQLEPLGLVRLPPPSTPSPLDPSHLAPSPLIHFLSADGCHATLCGHPEGPLVTLDLHEYVRGGAVARLTDDVVGHLGSAVRCLVLLIDGHTKVCEWCHLQPMKLSQSGLASPAALALPFEIPKPIFLLFFTRCIVDLR